MKLKRTLALIMGAALSIASLSGCSQATSNYADELTKVSKWEAISSEANGKMLIDVQGVKADLDFKSIGYQAGDKAYSKISFATSGGLEGCKFPEIEAYVDNDVIYINKSYYEQLFTTNGEEVPQGLKDIKADYIGLDSGMNGESLQALSSDPQEMISLVKSLFGDSDIDIPYVQNGREYTLNLGSDETVDLGVKGVKHIVNNIENINKTYGLGLTAEYIQDVKDSINNNDFITSVSSIKEAVKGSTISSKEVFDDDKYSADFSMNLLIKDIGNFNIQVNAVSTKSEVKDIQMPANIVKLTQEELQEALGISYQETTVNEAAQAKEIIINKAA